MFYVMYNTKSDVKGFVCIFFIVGILYQLIIINVKFYKQDQSPCFSTAGAEWKQIECTKRFYISFFAAFLDIYSPHFVRQILQEKHWIPDKKYFMQPWSNDLPQEIN